MSTRYLILSVLCQLIVMKQPPPATSEPDPPQPCNKQQKSNQDLSSQTQELGTLLKEITQWATCKVTDNDLNFKGSEAAPTPIDLLDNEFSFINSRIPFYIFLSLRPV